MCTFTSFNDVLFFFFFNDTATTEIYTLSLHDALPIYALCSGSCYRGSWTTSSSRGNCRGSRSHDPGLFRSRVTQPRSEEHTSELQSQSNLVCRLLLEKKKRRCHQPHTSKHSPSRCVPA